MYADTSGFQDNLKLSMEQFSYPLHHNLPSMEAEMERQLRFDMDSFNLIHDPYLTPSFDQSNFGEIQDLGFHHHHLEPPYPPTPDLLHLPRYLPTDNGSVLFDPLFHLNLPPQPPLFNPHGYGFPASMFCDDGDAQHDAVVEFSKSIDAGIGRKPRRGRIPKPYPTERDRRNHLTGKYSVLRSLVPNPTKVDRASIVSDAIGYIKELLRTVGELKILVEKKRHPMKKRKREGDGEAESSNPDAQSYNGSSLRSSWLQRQSKDTEVDVRLVDDEVTIKLVQRNNSSCLLVVSKVLDELQLDLHHVVGGNFGDYYSFMFNTKIHEGSCVYASAIANKIMEAVDSKPYAGGY